MGKDPWTDNPGHSDWDRGGSLEGAGQGEVGASTRVWSRKKKRFPGLDKRGTSTTLMSCIHNRWRVACSASCAGGRREATKNNAARGGSIIGKGTWHGSSRGPQHEGAKRISKLSVPRSLLLARRVLSNRGYSAVKRKREVEVSATMIDRCHRGRKRRPVARTSGGMEEMADRSNVSTVVLEYQEKRGQEGGGRQGRVPYLYYREGGLC